MLGWKYHNNMPLKILLNFQQSILFEKISW
jgi:hypothetical protein